MSKQNTTPVPFRDRELTDVDLIGNTEHQSAFASELFPVSPADFKDSSGSFSPRIVYQSYFAALAEELHVFTPEEHTIKTVDDLFSVLDILRQSYNMPKQYVIDSVTAVAEERGRHDDRLAEKAEASVELAAKWWLLADFQTYHFRLGDNAGRVWPVTRSLSEHIRTALCDDIEDTRDERPNRRFSRRFTLYDMDWLSLIKVRWTNNIAQHLYLEQWKDRTFDVTLYVFSHTAMMASIVQDPRLAGDSDGIKEFLNETMDTLDLLMDLRDPEASKWYRKIRKVDNAQRKKLRLPTEALDMFAGFPRRRSSLLSSNVSELRRVGHYKHWQHRLLHLEKAIEESRPTTVLGWWRYRRDLASFTTIAVTALSLLFAAMSLLLAIPSVVTGAMSVDLARKANVLAGAGKGGAGQANDMTRSDLNKESDSPDASTTTIPPVVETQTIVIVVQNACCEGAKCETGEETKTGLEERHLETPTIQQAAGVITFTTSTLKRR